MVAYELGKDVKVAGFPGIMALELGLARAL